MITGHVFMAMSLDGFVAREDHNLDWLMKIDTGGQDQGYDGFIADKDCIIMGKGSFNTVSTFDEWPYKLPVIVMSSSLTVQDIPKQLKGNVEISSLSPTRLMQSLEKKGMSKIYVDGGKIVQSFIIDNLIHDMTITSIPVLIGSGIRIFGKTEKDYNLELVSSRVLNGGFVQSKYTFPKD